MKKLNEKGFSLVELIIVIAIMAVLVGLLAPMYLKYVYNSKISVDLSNAQEIASEFNYAYSDGSIAAGTYTTIPSGVGMSYFPTVRMDPSLSWTVNVDITGVTSIKIGSEEVYPDPTLYLSHKK